MSEDEKDYVESEDEDFKPEAQQADDNVSSSSEDEDVEPAPKKGRAKATPKRKAVLDEDLDSGDEATIQEAKKKKRKKAKDDEEESGGEGGLIKTRAQRAAEKEERKEASKTHKGAVTIDVDSVWSSLISVPVGRRVVVSVAEQDTAKAEHNEDIQQQQPAGDDADESEFVTIKRVFEFAGQTVSEEKRVHRDSAEAKLYLSKNGGDGSDTPDLRTRDDGLVLRRPLKRASMFEPNPTGEVKGLPPGKQRLRTPSRADVLAQQKRKEEEEKAGGGKAQRLNTVQKSAIDWASHVDAEGLKDELAEYDRSKQGYMSKMDFLQGVQGRRDDDERRARLAKA